MAIINDWILIVCTGFQLPLVLLSIYCIPEHVVRLSKNFWPHVGTKGHKLSFSIGVNGFFNYICSLIQVLVCAYRRDFGELWFFYFFVPIGYSLIYYMMIVGSIRKMYPPRGVPVWDANQLNGTTIRQVSFFWEPVSGINLEQEPREDCNICFESYIQRFKPQYTCQCSHKQICHTCIIQQVSINRTCPWCRQEINELHIKMF